MSDARRGRAPRGQQATLAKLTPPSLGAAYPRERLFRLLDQSGSLPLIWIAGPPGAGKTTLAATWLAARRKPGIWCQLDSGDADAATFFYYLKRAAAGAGLRRNAALPLLTAEYQDDVPGFAHRWFRHLFSLLPVHAIVALDNYQEVAPDSAVHRAIAACCDEIPEGAQLVIVSRENPPPELARAVAQERVARIGPDELWLSPEEAQGIAAGQGALTGEQITELHAASGGWAAGFTLLRERTRRTGLVNRVDERGTMQEVFDYFMELVLREIPAHHREVLLKTAVLPPFTNAIATELTGRSDAAELLESLYRRHLFVERRCGDEITYQYHPLFRAFLLDQARGRFTVAERAVLSQEAATLLERSGAHEAALRLLLDAGDPGRAAAILERIAPGLAGAGRGTTYRDWLAKLPSSFSSRPLLCFWRASSLMGSNLREARADYERAYTGFVHDGDRTGQAMSVAGVLHTFLLAQDDAVSSFPRWLATIESLFADEPPFPSSALAASVYGTLVGIMAYMAPGHPMLPRCVNRLEGLLAEPLEDDVKVAAAAQLAGYYGWAGFVRDAERVIAATEPLARKPLLSPLARAYWYNLTSRCDWIAGEVGRMRAKASRALEIATENHRGPGGFVAQLMLLEVALDAGDLDAVPALLEHLADHIPVYAAQTPGGNHQASRFFWIRGKHAALTGDLDGAVRLLEQALAMTSETVTAFKSGTAVGLASVLIERGDLATARSVAAPWRDVYTPRSFPLLAFRHESLEAVIAAKEGDLELLAKVGARLRHLRDLQVGAPLPGQPILSRQLAELLVRHGIEVPYVRSWICRMKIRPSSHAPAEWPWPVRVRTLGEFAVEVGGTPLTFGGKVPRKPLALLQALIALGGRDVRTETLCNALWPDSEGDAAEIALRVTMTRLRKLLGCDALVQHQGRVSLDPRLCWTDATALRGLCRDIECGRPEPTASQLLDLYRGPFLEREREESWMLAARDEVRRDFTVAVATLARKLEREGGAEEGHRLRREAQVRDRHAVVRSA